MKTNIIKSSIENTDSSKKDGLISKHTTNLYTGSLDLNIPLQIPHNRDIHIDLSVNYNSNNSNGILGMGFDLNISSISINTNKKLPCYNETDEYQWNGQDLILDEQINNNQIVLYKKLKANTISKIEKIGNGEETYWKVTNSNNETTIYGKSEESRIYDKENPSKIYKWMISEVYDAKGNKIKYSYTDFGLGNNKYLVGIKYANYYIKDKEFYAYEILFNYGQLNIELTNKLFVYKGAKLPKKREDVIYNYRSGFLIATEYLTQEIFIKHHFEEKKTKTFFSKCFSFEYTAPKDNNTCNLLRNLTELNLIQDTENTYSIYAFPKQTFDFGVNSSLDNISSRFRFQPIRFSNKEVVNIPLNFVDLNKDGITGILYRSAETLYYHEPLGGGTFSKSEISITAPNGFIDPDLPMSITSLEGNGELQIVVNENSQSGFYSLTNSDIEPTFQPFPNNLINDIPQYTELVDLRGNSKLDYLIITPEKLYIRESIGLKGVDFKEVIIDNANGVEATNIEEPYTHYGFTNFFGDGLTHRIKIQNKEVTVWPNLGYGKFDKKITYPIPELDIQSNNIDLNKQLLLADVNGNGLTDILIVNSDHIQIYYNKGAGNFTNPYNYFFGNGLTWSEGDIIQIVNFKGNGNSSLVLSKIQYHIYDNDFIPGIAHYYYDFKTDEENNFQSSLLLHTINNNMGIKTIFSYKSSVQDYLNLKNSSDKWYTSLPFPTITVSEIRTIDEINQAEQHSTYTYRNGYYDPDEKQFLGFGNVNEVVTNTKSSDSKTNNDSLLKTWFHIGQGFNEKNTIDEFYKGDQNAPKIPITRENYSTNDLFHLAGQTIRAELYDLSDVSCPYTVTSTCYSILKSATSPTSNQHTYSCYADETISINYEKRADDPKVNHHFVLETDDFNNTIKECSITYPRREPLIIEQGILFCNAQEHFYLNQADKNIPYFIGIELETKKFEVRGLELDKNLYFTLDSIKEKLVKDDSFVNQIPNSQVPEEGYVQTRLIAWSKNAFWSSQQQDNEWTNEMIFPEVALLKHTAVASFDNIQVRELLKEKVGNLDLIKAGYIWDQESTYWWKNSVVNYYDNVSTSFLVPIHSAYDWVDKNNHLYTEESITYDVYKLFHIKDSKRLNDDVCHVNTYEIDYRVLAPSFTIDINDNIQEVLYDGWGRMNVTATYNKNKTEGDLPLSEWKYIPATLEEIIAHPKKYLQQAGSFTFHELPKLIEGVWLPASVIALTRTAYRQTNENDIRCTIVYYDSTGQELEKRSLYTERESKARKWIVSDAVQYNAQGKIEYSFLNKFSDSWKYENKNNPEWCDHRSIHTYDLLQREIRIDSPKGFFSLINILNAWETQTYDFNDTILESKYYINYKEGKCELDQYEKDALDKAIRFYKTPSTTITDGLGHEIMTVISNKSYDINSVFKPLIDKSIEKLASEDINTKVPDLLVSWQRFDSSSRVLLQADARLNEFNYGKVEGDKRYNFMHQYALGDEIVSTYNCDGGWSFGFKNVHGVVVSLWDGLDIKTTTNYDALQRPVSIHVQTPDNHDGERVDQIISVFKYGESVPEAKNKNLFGKLYQQYDGAGLFEIPAYTFDGHSVEELNRFRKDYKTEANWSNNNIALKEHLLEKEIFKTQTYFNALGKAIKQIHPDNSMVEWELDNQGSCIASFVTSGGCKKRIPVLKGHETDENGHSKKIVYANGIHTNFKYDALSLDLKQIKTLIDNVAIQEQNYWHAPTEVITTIENKCEKTVFYDNQLTSPETHYNYDALYRLLASGGRKQRIIGSANNKAVEMYTETFCYDKGNNMLQLKHLSNKNSYTRNYEIDKYSNRVLKYRQSEDVFTINYNQAGYMLNTLHSGSGALTWNVAGNISSATIIKRKNEKNDAEYYIYRNGIRLRKVKETLDSTGKVLSKTDKLYLGDYRQTKSAGNVKYSITIPGTGKNDCVIQYDTDTKAMYSVNNPLLRFQHGNHLHSIGLETNAKAEVISYEEYNVFGETTYLLNPKNLDSSKEYRYSSQEKDDTTGLYYYGYRYYAPALCRWTRPDPAGIIDGLNLYCFVGNEPIAKVDILGLVNVHGRLSRFKDNDAAKIAKTQLARHRDILTPSFISSLESLISKKPWTRSKDELSVNHRVSDKHIRNIKDDIKNNQNLPEVKRQLLKYVKADMGEVPNLPKREVDLLKEQQFQHSPKIKSELDKGIIPSEALDFLNHFAKKSHANLRIGNSRLNSKIRENFDPNKINGIETPITKSLKDPAHPPLLDLDTQESISSNKNYDLKLQAQIRRQIINAKKGITHKN